MNLNWKQGVNGLKKAKGRPSKRESEEAELERLRIDAKRALLKKFHTELRKEFLAKRNIGLSTIIAKNMK